MMKHRNVIANPDDSRGEAISALGLLRRSFGPPRNDGETLSRLDYEILLVHLLGITRMELYMNHYNVKPHIIDKFNLLTEERASGKPLQYILGKTEFMGLEFIVTPDVFIPRPETELLVEETIKTIRSTLFAIRYPRILDIGAGSGNIAISLTKFLPNCRIIGLDVSRRAVAIAQENARRNLVGEQIKFLVSDLFENLTKLKFDIIVSNPPYVAAHEFGGLSKEIGFEPRIALDGGLDGLDFYRSIVNGAGRFLADNGFLIFEIGLGQAGAVEALLRAYGFSDIRFVMDYNSVRRVVTAKWKR